MLKIEKFTDVCNTGGMHYTSSHTNVCKFHNFQVTADISPEMLKLDRVTKVFNIASLHVCRFASVVSRVVQVLFGTVCVVLEASSKFSLELSVLVFLASCKLSLELFVAF